jgi:hypothetical protein
MKTVAKIVLAVMLLSAGATWWLGLQGHAWTGVDETVVEKYAADSGYPAREPYINTNKGDLLLFFFLIAGTLGGFLAGYCFRELFPPNTKEDTP